MATDRVEVTSADIARIAGVRPSAVSNWRRRHEDFPTPVGGTDKSPRFDLAQVATWLRRQGKASEISTDERLWQAFTSVRGVMSAADALVMVGILLLYQHRHPQAPVPIDREELARVMSEAEHSMIFGGDTVVAGLADLLTPFDLSARQITLLHAAAETAAANGPADTFDYLVSRFLDSGSYPGFTATPPELAELMLDLTGSRKGTLLDPACGSGTILLAAAARGYRRVEGQELNPSLARVAALRLTFRSGPKKDHAFDIHWGDSLREDAYPRRSARAIVCNPPFGDRNWGQDELAHDSRWEYGVPPRLESELAWVQHALAHVVPGGTAVMLMPPAAAARSSGRRIRAELVRRGALRAVISLPPRRAAQYALALQIWVLHRPSSAMTPSRLLVVDATGLTLGHEGTPDTQAEALPAWDTVRGLVVGAWTAFQSDPDGFTEQSGVARAIPIVNILTEEVDLTPRRHLPLPLPPASTHDDLVATRARLLRLLAELPKALPEVTLAASPENGATREVTLEELAQTGTAFVRRAHPRAISDQKQTGAPTREGRIVTGRDVVLGQPPSETAEVLVDEVRNPSIRIGDVLLPMIGRRLTACVATDDHAGAYLSPSVYLIRLDTTVMDPWFLAGYLSSSDGGRQAARMASTLGARVRFDPRRVRIPLLPIEIQQAYGNTFRRLSEFARTLYAAQELGQRLVHDITDVLIADLTNIGVVGRYESQSEGTR